MMMLQINHRLDNDIDIWQSPLSPGQFDYQVFKSLLARYARLPRHIITVIILIVLASIIIFIFITTRENVAVVNVFLNAPQTQILDVNEKTSIIDAVRDDDEKNADANYLKRSEQYGCS